jgi:hypothetical protein
VHNLLQIDAHVQAKVYFIDNYGSYPLSTQKRVLKHFVCSKLGIKWLKWIEYTVK